MIKEVRADDASAAPDRGDIAEVKVPIVKLAGRAQLDETLRVADDFAGIERIADGVKELGPVARERLW